MCGERAGKRRAGDDLDEATRYPQDDGPDGQRPVRVSCCGNGGHFGGGSVSAIVQAHHRVAGCVFFRPVAARWRLYLT